MDHFVTTQIISYCKQRYGEGCRIAVVGSRAYDAVRPGSDIDIVVYGAKVAQPHIMYASGYRICITTHDDRNAKWHSFTLPKRDLVDNVEWDYDLEDIISYITWRHSYDPGWIVGRKSNNKDIQRTLDEIQKKDR